MGAAKKLIDKKVLRDLIPINALSANHIEEISKKALIEDVRSGTYVFKRGDRDYQTVYLLEGKVELLDENRDVVGTVAAGSEAARHPLAHKQPRQQGVRAAGKVTVARIDSSLLDVLLTWDESAGYDVVEIDAQDDDDWMTRMLQSQAFLQLPPSNIHQLLMRLEAVSASAGDVIVRQDDEGDYFYIVKSGRLAVTRKASPRSKEVLLAELGEGACFGEEALVSGTKRNASVMMVTDGSLMRLSKDDFQELLCAPLVHETGFEDALKLVEQGAKWLDVRLPGEFQNQAIKGSSNLPLSALRDQCADLDLDTDYIVCCDTGRRSAAGAFVLSQRGFSVYTLKNGLMDVPETALTGNHGGKAAEAANDADIIPFDADTRPDAADAAGDEAPADDLLIDKLANVENDKLGLEQQLARLQLQLKDAENRAQQVAAQQRREQTGAEQLQQKITALTERIAEGEQQAARQIDALELDKRTLQDEVQSLQGELASGRQRLETADSEKQSLQEELNRLQQTLSQIQQSAEGRDDALRHELEQMAARLEAEQQRHDKQTRDLEQELERVRDDYHQLGQRTSAVAGERDAAARDATALQEKLAGLQEQLSAGQAEQQQAVEALRQALSEREQSLEAAQTESQDLTKQLQSVESERLQLEQQLAAAGEQSEAETRQSGELQARLEAAEQQAADHQAALQDASRQLESLQEQLQQAEQQAQEQSAREQAAATEEKQALQQRIDELQQQLEQTSGEIGAERDTLAETVGQLQQERDALGDEKQALEQELQKLQQLSEEQRQQLEAQQALEQQLAEVQQQLDDTREQHGQLQAEREKAAEKTLQLEEQATQADERVAGLETELEQAHEQHRSLEQRNTELDERLAMLSKEHQSDLASTREALSRAQTETENVQREQKRLMASLRKAEGDLQNERHDHEAEVRRLHKKLKDADGESNAGLAAELEASQGKIREQARARDDLEIKLGERSAQLEDVQAEVEKLGQQLHQAQDSARQAEQQLLEANQAANEEMAVRMEAEEKAQQALRDEISSAIAERNRSQEQLTVQLHELDELRTALETAQQDAAAREETGQAALAAMQQERDAALEQQQAVQKEVDQLRAEAEVTRGLVDMQATPGGVDAALREELEQAKKNVDVAVRLRSQAEDRSAALDAELETLRAQLQASPGQQSPGHIPSLDEDDPHAAAVLVSEYPDDEDDAQPADPAEVAHNNAPVNVSVGTPLSEPSAATGGGGLKGLFTGVLLGAVLVGGGAWWLLKQQQPATAVRSDGESTVVVKKPDTVKAPAEIPADKPAESRSRPQPAAPVKPPAGIPDFARGSSGKSGTAPAVESPVSATGRGDENEDATGTSAEPAPLSDTAAPEKTVPARPQPVRTFSEPLADGGRSPTLVTFRADSFDMGSGASSANFDERPRHRVQLRGFSISKQEVTFAEYDRFARATGRRLPSDAGWGRGSRPVINVRWQDALAYTQWLSAQTGSHYRLPTESEWEFAARAGSDTRFWWGNNVGEGRANCFDCGGQLAGLKTAPVGSFAASPFGVQDMSGNVMEWVQDCYQPDYTAAPADGSAVSGGDCSRRVVRGGAYGSPSESLRSASRDARDADTRLDNLGFRVVKD